jgi:hypothetical protein
VPDIAARTMTVHASGTILNQERAKTVRYQFGTALAVCFPDFHWEASWKT